SGIESTYETSLMFISPLTLLPGSRQCFLFFVTKSQNLVMNRLYKAAPSTSHTFPIWIFEKICSG
ncbi:hypothetical protein, partial [Parageobacillus thermoglucosidasius]|uniref:hypothetical protein n=1 Tax=Parageobacillus thermoglucosidasius TaxID=1426 RepID=UPI001B805A81